MYHSHSISLRHVLDRVPCSCICTCKKIYLHLHDDLYRRSRHHHQYHQYIIYRSAHARRHTHTRSPDTRHNTTCTTGPAQRERASAASSIKTTTMAQKKERARVHHRRHLYARLYRFSTMKIDDEGDDRKTAARQQKEVCKR